MHMAWLETVGGRLKGDFRYSNTLVYNTFVVPNPSDEQSSRIDDLAAEIISIRENYLKQGNDLADLYDSILMPSDLRKVHQRLDKVVDRLYGLNNPTNEQRVAVLMRLYKKEIQK